MGHGGQHSHKKTWKGINQLINRSKSKRKSIFLNDNGLVTDQRQVANKFNNYFINVAENLSSKIPNKNTKFQDYLKNPNRSRLFLKETTPDEIQQIVNDINANKSSDIYDISPRYVKFSLLLIFSKIFERLMYNRMIEFIERNKILSQNQFGFQKNKSTVSCCFNYLSHYRLL